MVLNYASRMLMRLRAGTKKSKCLSYHFMLENSMIHQLARGIYALLPIGDRCVAKLTRLIESELNAIGAQRVDLPRIARRNIWEASGRWSTLGSELFRLRDRDGIDYCLQPTAEEVATKMMAEVINLPRRNTLPMMFYQTNEKFRDESFSKFGFLRSRQFLMNDLYTFHADDRCAQATYKKMADVYMRLFTERLGLLHVYNVAADPGLIGGSASHEFHLLNPCREAHIHICSRCGHSTIIENTSISTTLAEERDADCDGGRHEYITRDSVEVAHMFRLGAKYAEPLNAALPDGRPYTMCCFGVGITRLLAACIDELSVDESAMRLPDLIAPFKMAMILPKEGDKDPRWQFTLDTLNELVKMPQLHDDIFVDDRTDRSVGRRLVDANRLGIPHIFVSNSMKSDNPFAPMTFEYFRAVSREKELRAEGRISHAELFKLAEKL